MLAAALVLGQLIQQLGLNCNNRSDLVSPLKSFLASEETLAVEFAVAVAVPGASSVSVTVMFS